MKGRALLHHNVQLDDRATLASVPGVKDGTILRVDKQVSQVRNKIGKKTVMCGPVRAAVDEDVVGSIEKSSDDEETSSENERRMSSSKRKRLSRSSMAAGENSIDDDYIGISQRPKALVPGEMSDNSLDMADTDLSNRTTAPHIVKREKRKNVTRKPADSLASEAQKLGPRQHTLNHIFASPPENAQDVMADDTGFLAGISAAAAKMQILPLHSQAGPEEDVSVRRCDTCGRAYWCGGDSSDISNSVLPVYGSIRGQEVTNINSNARLIPQRSSTSQPAESSWTGM